MKTLAMAMNTGAFFLSHRRELAEAALARGWRVAIIVPPSADTEKIRALGFETHEWQLSRSGANPIKEARSLLELIRLLKKIRPTLFHGFTAKCIVYGAIASRLLGVPAVLTVTGLGYVFTEPKLATLPLRMLVSALYHCAFSGGMTRICVQNADDRAFLVDRGMVSAANCLLIPGTGVNLEAFSAPVRPIAQGEPPRVLFASRFLLHKGWRELVEAAEALARDGLEFRLVLCGKPDPGNRSSISSEEYDRVRSLPFVDDLGFRSDMAKVYSENDIICLPSYREGLPLTILEAMASGRPVITTDAPGCRDTVIEGVNGFLVPVGDSRALAHALKRLLLDPKLRRRMGLKGREIAEATYDQKRILGQYLENYDSLAA